MLGKFAQPIEFVPRRPQLIIDVSGLDLELFDAVLRPRQPRLVVESSPALEPGAKLLRVDIVWDTSCERVVWERRVFGNVRQKVGGRDFENDSQSHELVHCRGALTALDRTDAVGSDLTASHVRDVGEFVDSELEVLSVVRDGRCDGEGGRKRRHKNKRTAGGFESPSASQPPKIGLSHARVRGMPENRLMVRKQHLPDDLSPRQATALQDALLANADKLLRAALTMLKGDNVPLARSLAILGMEESGKAIALHERRVRMAYAPEGDPFVDKGLRELWGLHGLKLKAVHSFLVNEDYWFDTEPPDRDENARVLGTIEEWQREHNVLKQRGFYVDVTPDGEPITPQETADADAVRDVIAFVHQIGWQLRLGEHIEGKSRLQREKDVPPASNDEIQRIRDLMKGIDAELADGMAESMRQETKGEKLNNAAYAFILQANPFETVGRPGYEAQDRELWALLEEDTDAEEDDSER